MKTNKKGFTIVELTIVIAVIAILAAVLIPTFVSLVKKADNSADVQMVTNINKYLASIEATDGRNKTIVEAMKDIEDAGYKAEALANATNDIIWDPVNDRVLAVKKDGEKVIAGSDDLEEALKKIKGENKKNYWIVSTEVSSEYPTCLTGKTANLTDIKLSLDLTNYRSNEAKVTVTAADVELYGVIHTLNAGSNNPTVHGYVYILNGNITSDNAVFHDESDNISGKYTINCYDADGDKVCDFCGKSDRFACQHNMVVDKEEAATCTSTGYKLNKCSTCGYTEIETIAVLPHTEATDKAVAATCTETGLTEGKHCSVCEKVLVKQEIVEALGHSFKNYVSNNNAECDKDGTETAKCERCDVTDTRTEEGSSTKAGTTAIYQCEKCKATKGGEATPLADHDIVIDVLAKAATCTEDGWTAGQHCANCNTQTVISRQISATGHKFGKSYKDNYKCANCNECREKTNISGDILTEGMELIPGSCYIEVVPNELQAYADSIVFGFTEDYIDKIEASKNYSKYSTRNDDVFIYAVKIENNSNCELDDRDYLLEIYVLSDKVMCYSGNAQLFSSYGMHIIDENSIILYEGAVREVRLENFDTTAATDLSNLFQFCYIENLYLGQNMIVPTGAKTENTFDDARFATVKHENNGWTVEPGEDLLATDSDKWPSKIQKKNTEA